MEQLKENNNKPYYAGLRLGGLYDSRVGSSSSTSSGESDSGGAVTLNAGWQAPIKGDFGLRFDYGGYASFYQDLTDYNVIDQSLSIEPQYTMGAFTYSLPMAFNYAMEDAKTDYYKYSVSPTLTYLIPRTSQAVALYGTGFHINDQDDYSEDEDADAIGAGCAYIFFFQNSSTVRLSVDYQHAKYDELVGTYESTLSTDKRKDNSLAAGLDIQYQFTKILGVYVNYSYIHSTSNVDTYEYNRHIVEGGVALKF